MTYSVSIEQHLRLSVEFSSEEDFLEWEESGASISDLGPSQIIREKIHSEWIPNPLPPT